MKLNIGGNAAEILSRYNTSLFKTASNGMFATMALLILDPESEQLEFANAGACIDYLKDAIDRFIGNAPQSDDVTLLALTRQ